MGWFSSSGGGKDIAILGRAGSRKEPEPVRGLFGALTPVDEDEEDRIMREDD